MKMHRNILIMAGIISLTSCLKAKNDVAGILTDPGQIVTSISESQYLSADLQNIGFHYTHGSFANVALTGGNEAVKFFTLKVSQARGTRVSGPLKIQFSSSPVPGYDELPAGAIVITDSVITVPENKEQVFEYPVRFNINKSLLQPDLHYAVHITLNGANQGVVNALDDEIDVIFNMDLAFNTSRYSGRYVATTTIEDSAKVYGITQNKRTYILTEGRYDPFFAVGGSTSVGNAIFPTDLYAYAFGLFTESFSLMSNSISTGARQAIIQPVYQLDANGKVVDVLSRTGLVSLQPVFDNSAPNAFEITSNNERTLSVKYKVYVTLNGLTRSFTITDKYIYDKNQIAY